MRCIHPQDVERYLGPSDLPTDDSRALSDVTSMHAAFILVSGMSPAWTCAFTRINLQIAVLLNMNPTWGGDQHGECIGNVQEYSSINLRAGLCLQAEVAARKRDRIDTANCAAGREVSLSFSHCTSSKYSSPPACLQVTSLPSVSGYPRRCTSHWTCEAQYIVYISEAHIFLVTGVVGNDAVLEPASSRVVSIIGLVFAGIKCEYKTISYLCNILVILRSSYPYTMGLPDKVSSPASRSSELWCFNTSMSCEIAVV